MCLIAIDNYVRKSSLSLDSCTEDTMSTSGYIESTKIENISVHNLNDSKYLENNRQIVHINKYNFSTLIGTSWVNNNACNAYLDLIQQRSQDNPNLPQVHCYKPSFLTTLSSKGYKAVRKWTKKVDVFQKDILIIPCHLSNNHWTLAVVDLNNKRMSYYDSLGGKDYGLLYRICSYLNQESMRKLKIDFDLSGWEVYCLGKRSPQQRNNYDGGAFAMVTAELVSRKEEISFSHDDMEAFRKRIYSEIFNGKLCKE